MRTIIVDIDGTVADCSHRLHHIMKTPKDHDAFYEACDQDEPIHEIIHLVETLHRAGYFVIFMTGRPHRIYTKTRDWINRHMHLEDKYTLLMRQNGDHRQDSVIKSELYQKYISWKYTVDFVIEDRASVVKMWRELAGLRCLQVDEGDF
jgi:hydroxymethylpyrimidine pyrophosphatase-like HAD family hydrolase